MKVKIIFEIPEDQQEDYTDELMKESLEASGYTIESVETIEE